MFPHLHSPSTFARFSISLTHSQAFLLLYQISILLLHHSANGGRIKYDETAAAAVRYSAWSFACFGVRALLSLTLSLSLCVVSRKFCWTNTRRNRSESECGADTGEWMEHTAHSSAHEIYVIWYVIELCFCMWRAQKFPSACACVPCSCCCCQTHEKDGEKHKFFAFARTSAHN